MLVLEQEDQELYDRIQEKNPLRQYDLLANCIEIGIKQGPRAFDKYMLWDLNTLSLLTSHNLADGSAKNQSTWAITSHRISVRFLI